MASTIIIKHGEKNAVPTSLTQGEFAINVDNGNLYYGSGSLNAVKQNLSLETFRISGSQTLATNVDANTPLVGTNMHSGTEEGDILISGSFNSDSTWDINIFATPDTNHSADLELQLKVTQADSTVLMGTTELKILWDGSDYSTDGSLEGLSYFFSSPNTIPMANIINIGSILNSDATNFSLEGPTTIDSTDCIILNWSNMSPALTPDLDNADFELVINYKVSKY